MDTQYSCHVHASAHPWTYVDFILVINMGYRWYMAQCVTLKSVVNVGSDAYARSRNEAQVGSAVQKSGIPREDVYITTKVGGWAGICQRLAAACRDTRKV